jgi:hypothetical protein
MGKKRNARKRRLPVGTAPTYGSTDDLTQFKTSKISTSTGKNNDFIEISDEDIIEIIEPAELDAGPSKLSETLAIMHTDTSEKIDALLNARNFIIVQVKATIFKILIKINKFRAHMDVEKLMQPEY